jgi:hypothetical protein
MEMRSSPAWPTAPELNVGEGVGPLGQGATPSFGKAPGPMHWERRGVRWLSTDSVVQNGGDHGGDGLPEADKGTGTDKMQRDGPLL